MGKLDIKKNYIYNTAFQVFSLLITVITVPYVSRILGVYSVGKYSFANSIASYFVMFAIFGSSLYGQRQISFYRDSKSELSQTFWNIVFFRLFMSSIMLCIYFLFFNLFQRIDTLSIILSLTFFGVVTDINWFFQGIERFKQIALRNIGVKIVCTILVFTFVKGPDDVWIYAFIICISNITGNMTMWISIQKYIEKPKRVHLFSDFKGMLLVFLPTIAIQVYVILDKSMIGWITGSDYNNGCYEQAEQIARVSLTVVVSIGTVILPRVGNLYKRGELETAKEYIYKAYRFVWLLSCPMAIGLVGIAPVLIPVFLGPGYEGAIILLKIFAMLVIIVSLANITGIAFLIPTEQQNVYTIAVFVSAVINFFMNLFLISRFQAVGAAISSVTAELIGIIIQVSYCCFTKQLQLHRIVGSVWKYAASSVVMYMIVVCLRSRFETSFFLLIAIIIIAMLSYFMCLLIIRDDYTMKLLRQTIKKFSGN